MSNLSEEEIIEYVKELINATYIEATKLDKDGDVLREGRVDKNIIYGLLDLYTKEKENSKYYKEELDTYYKMYLREKEKNKKYEEEQYNVTIMETEYFKDNYISVDKIKELKEKIHWDLDKNGFTRSYQLVVDKYFEELLGGE